MGRAVFPGAAMFEAARSAGAMSTTSNRLERTLAMNGITIPAPLLLEAKCHVRPV